MKRFNKLPKTPQGIQAVRKSIQGKNNTQTLKNIVELKNGYGMSFKELIQLR